MKDGIKKIVGKTISAVVVAEKERGAPENQVFLVFSDNTSFELYGAFNVASGTDPGGIEAACRYAKQCGAHIGAVYPEKE